MTGRALDPASFFQPRSLRKDKAGSLARMDRLGGETGSSFLRRFAFGALLLDGKIPNPDELQLNYFRQVLGDPGAPEEAVILRHLDRWLPRMTPGPRRTAARELTGILEAQRRAGKPPAVLANLYVKMMCWLYYRAGTVLDHLEDGQVPKAVFLGVPGGHELLFLRLLASLGADVLLLQPDPARQTPDIPAVDLPAGAFPPGFSLQQLLRERASVPPAPARAVPGGAPGSAPAGPSHPLNRAVPGRTPPGPAGPAPAPARPPQAYRPPASSPRPSMPVPETCFKQPRRSACTNAWLEQPDYRLITSPLPARGGDPERFYNAFIRVDGAEDKVLYQSHLMAFADQLRQTGRPFRIVNGGFGRPDPQEISKVRRRPYRNADELIIDQAMNLPAGLPEEFELELQRAFVSVMREAAKTEPSLNRLTSTAVYLHCWLRPLLKELFPAWRESNLPCLIHMGGCQDPSEALFLRLLAALPVDVLIFAPNLNRPCLVQDPVLLDLRFADSLPDMAFPLNNGTLQVRTVASHAEGELNELLYDGSGMFRAQQYARADAVILQSTVDEIRILWDQELKYRTGFSAGADKVTMPVFFAKVCGVPDRLDRYWQDFKLLSSSPDAFLIRSLPFLQPGEGGSMMGLAQKVLRGGHIDRDALRQDRKYPYGFLRAQVQDHMLDKLQLMLDRKLVRGTFVNGTEYRVIAVALSLPKEILRLLQAFDFTKKNPKLLCFAASEAQSSLEDAILMAFLNLCGFDVVLCVPTGYQTVERHLEGLLPVEHQLGEYRYDLTLPDLSTVGPAGGVLSRLGNLFKRGN